MHQTCEMHPAAPSPRGAIVFTDTYIDTYARCQDCANTGMAWIYVRMHVEVCRD